MFLSVAQVPIAIHAFGEEGFGLWVTLTATVALLSFADFGITNGMQNRIAGAFARNDEYQINRVFWTATIVLAGVGALVFLISWMVVPFFNWASLFHVNTPALRSQTSFALVLLVIGFAMGLPLSTIPRLLAGIQQGWLQGIINLTISIWTIVAILFCARLKLDFLFFIGLIAIATPLVHLASYLWMHRVFPFVRPQRSMFSLMELRSLAHLGWQFLIPQIGASVLAFAPQLIVSNSLGAAAVTPFNLCQRVVGVLQQIQTIALTPVWPAYSEAHQSGDIKWIRMAFGISLGGSVAIFALAALGFSQFGSALIEFWTGSSSELPSPALINWFSAWLFLTGIGVPMAYLLNGLSRLKGVLVYGSLNMVATVVAMPIAAKYFGASGVVMSMCLSYLVIVLPANSVDVCLALAKNSPFKK